MEETASDEAPRPTMTTARRKELVHMAEALADDLAAKVGPHERCFFRRAVEMFMERD